MKQCVNFPITLLAETIEASQAKSQSLQAKVHKNSEQISIQEMPKLMSASNGINL